MSFINNRDKILQVIYQNIVPLLIIIFTFSGASVLWYMDRQQSSLVRTLTLNNAKLYTQALTEFRTLYTSEVVEALQDQDIQVTHDYKQHPGAIPLPVTLSILLGQNIGLHSADADIKIYSPYPFPWRQQQGGLSSDFAKSAWQHLQKSPQTPYYIFDESEGGEVLRFAIADTMRPECINCHNNHAQSPKRDWKAGDVRGILEVALPIKKVVHLAGTSMKGVFWLISGISSLGLLTLFLLIGRLSFNYKKSKHALEDKVEQHQMAEIELQEFNEDLKNTLDKIQRMQASMIESETMAALGGMVAGVAHEINTPLGVSITATSLLDEQIRKLSSCYQQGNLTRNLFETYQQESLESTKIMAHNLNRAADLIQSFKQVAVDQTSHARRSFNLNQYLEDVILALKPQLKKTRHQIKINCPEILLIDSFPGSFSQIITNLITNSLKHGFEDVKSGEISLTIEQKKTQLVLCYQDNGKGISPDLLHKIYEPFFTTSRHNGGSGLGMHLVFNIVSQLFHGEIHCESEMGQGVKFKITLPFSEALISLDEQQQASNLPHA